MLLELLIELEISIIFPSLTNTWDLINSPVLTFRICLGLIMKVLAVPIFEIPMVIKPIKSSAFFI
jgi:hypothetical protein